MLCCLFSFVSPCGCDPFCVCVCVCVCVIFIFLKITCFLSLHFKDAIQSNLPPIKYEDAFSAAEIYLVILCSLEECSVGHGINFQIFGQRGLALEGKICSCEPLIWSLPLSSVLFRLRFHKSPVRCLNSGIIRHERQDRTPVFLLPCVVLLLSTH